VTAAMTAAGRLPVADGGGWASASGTWPAAVAGGTAGAPGRASLADRGFVRARFGGVAVLVGPELAAQIKANRRKQP
jgi:hypothetical protein